MYDSNGNRIQNVCNCPPPPPRNPRPPSDDDNGGNNQREHPEVDEAPFSI